MQRYKSTEGVISINMDKTIQKIGFSKKELLLIKPLLKEPWREFTLTEIKRSSGNKSHHYVFEALKQFSSFGILKEEKRGNTNNYRLNELSTDISYLVLLEALIRQERKDIPFNNVLKVVEKIKNKFYSLFVVGSYAEKKQKPNSDMDLAIIIPDTESKKPYEVALKEGEFTIPEIHGLVFSETELLLMLTNKEFNFGKEIVKKHVLIAGAEPYYKILFEALQNGFKG